MSKKHILNSMADGDQADSQAATGKKTGRKFIFPTRKAEPGAPLPEDSDVQDSDKNSDPAVKSKLDAVRIKDFILHKNKPGAPVPQTEDDEPEANSSEANTQENDTNSDSAVERKPNKPRIQVPILRKKKEKSPGQQETEEDSAEAGEQSAEEKESIFQDIPEKFNGLVEKILPEDQEAMLTRILLDYLDRCLESGEEPEWEYITRGNDSGEENFLLPVHQKYITSYLLGNLLKADYVEGFAVEDDGTSKQLRVTTGIQITAAGRRRLKELTGMGRITALLRSIKNCTPGM